jgi:type II secretory pathway component PulL
MLMISYPDPYANPRRMRRYRAIVLIVGAALVFFALVSLKAAHDSFNDAQGTLRATRAAEALLPSEAPRRPPTVVDPKQKTYLLDLRATSAKLSVDWIARIARVEKVIGPDMSLNSLRVDTQKGEIELKGETSSSEKLTTLIATMQRTGLDARVGRLGRLTTGLEYSVLVAWPQ